MTRFCVTSAGAEDSKLFPGAIDVTIVLRVLCGAQARPEPCDPIFTGTVSLKPGLSLAYAPGELRDALEWMRPRMRESVDEEIAEVALVAALSYVARSRPRHDPPDPPGRTG